MNPLNATAVDRNALPGLGGQAMRRLGPLVTACERELCSVARDAAARWIRGHGPRSFNARELGRIISAFSASTAASELLGRSQMRLLGTDYVQFSGSNAADPPVFERFDAAVPALTPHEALQYFLRLVPQLGIDPDRFGPRIERHAFTLAEATEKTLIERVQRAIANEIAGQRIEDPQGRGSQPLSPTERVQQALDAAGVTPKNPQYAEMAVRTNVMDSYHAGIDRELATPDMQEAFPVWQYLGIRDGREGEDHRPKFDRYFSSIFSFNEVRGKRVWNCRCSKRPIFARAWARLESGGAKIEIDW